MKKISELYDAESQIDFGKIVTILDRYVNKDIYCFGGGSAAEILTKQVLYKYKLAGFLDNNSSLWGKKIDGIEVKNPECITNLRKGKFVILILSKHLNAITEQLQSYGLEENIDFIDIYSEFSTYFRIKKFQLSAEKYYNFIKRMPKDLFKKSDYKSEKRIGVVCIASMVDWETWYAITIFLILKCQGYKVTLIMDNMKSFDDFIYFEQHAEITKIYTDYIIEYLKTHFNCVDIDYIDKNKTLLNEADNNEINRLVDVNVLWQSMNKDELIGVGEEERRIKYYEILQENLKYIKGYFNCAKYDVVNVITGLHKSRGLYMWEGKKRGIRVSTYDGAGADSSTYFVTSGPCSYVYDIPKQIKRLNLDEKKELCKIADTHFNKRIHSIMDDGGYNFQTSVNLEKNQEFFDVIIPLNVIGDGASLGLDDIFDSEKEWLVQTIEFLLENTEATICVREHPALKLKEWREYNVKRCDYLKNRYGERVYFCEYFENINTYRLMEHAKVVLPYTSTIGNEAVMLGIPIVTHTNVYYSQLDFANKCYSKEEYFEKIIEFLNEEKGVSKKEQEEAALSYMGIMSMVYYKTEFRETTDSWMNYTINELLECKGVKDIIDVIANDETLVYKSI